MVRLQHFRGSRGEEERKGGGLERGDDGRREKKKITGEDRGKGKNLNTKENRLRLRRRQAEDRHGASWRC